MFFLRMEFHLEELLERQPLVPGRATTARSAAQGSTAENGQLYGIPDTGRRGPRPGSRARDRIHY